MKSNTDAPARKRPVNLTLNEGLVSQARSMTDNLSGVVESLLADFVAREQRHRIERSKAIEFTVALWNKFNAEKGSISDEYSTL
jgi:antitoxin CcdA